MKGLAPFQVEIVAKTALGGVCAIVDECVIDDVSRDVVALSVDFAVGEGLYVTLLGDKQ